MNFNILYVNPALCTIIHAYEEPEKNTGLAVDVY